jgi:hypothetical protein
VPIYAVLSEFVRKAARFASLMRRVVRVAVPQAKYSVYRAAWYLKLPVKSDLPRLFPVVDRDAFDPFSFRVS